MPRKPSAKSPTPVLAPSSPPSTRTSAPTSHRGTARLRGRRRKSVKKTLYPRDPSLDPQLVWKGKDEQNRQPLEVPAVPIYIQEKIHPQLIIETCAPVPFAHRMGEGSG